MLANSRPVNEALAPAVPLGSNTPMSAQIASAVSLLSPVMTTTRIPALLHAAIAAGTSGRGDPVTPRGRKT